MADLVVDVDGLDDLVSTIKNIQDGLNNTKDVVDQSKPILGSGEVAGAMDHFQSHWKDGRKHINDNADSMTSMLSQSVTSFRKADGDLAKSVTSNTTTSTIGHGGPGQSRAE